MHERLVKHTMTKVQAELVHQLLAEIAASPAVMAQLGLPSRRDATVLENAVRRLKDAIKKQEDGMMEKMETRYPGYAAWVKSQGGRPNDLLVPEGMTGHDYHLHVQLSGGAVKDDPLALATKRVTEQNVPGQRPRNVHCSVCGDTRGGPLGHETSECTWDGTEDAPFEFPEPSYYDLK